MCASVCVVGRTVSSRLRSPLRLSLQKEKVAAGDVIYIEANSGAVKRVGR